MAAISPAATTWTAPAPLEMDERLALCLLDMDERLDRASVTFEVNTAYIPHEELATSVPLTAPATQPLRPYTTPIAAVLQRALARLLTVGWSAEHWDEQGAICLVRAIRTEAGDGPLSGEACQFLLDAIRVEFGPWETVPSWNEAQVGPATPIRILGQAADQAAARGI